MEKSKLLLENERKELLSIYQQEEIEFFDKLVHEADNYLFNEFASFEIAIKEVGSDGQ